MAVIHDGDSQRAMTTVLPAELVEAVEDLAVRHGIPRQKLVEQALRNVLTTPPPAPAVLRDAAYRRSLPLRAAEVYEALVRAYTGLGPVLTRALADDLGIHRGNVDRHLAVLRAQGLARRDGHGHVPTIIDSQEAAAS